MDQGIREGAGKGKKSPLFRPRSRLREGAICEERQWDEEDPCRVSLEGTLALRVVGGVSLDEEPDHQGDDRKHEEGDPGEGEEMDGTLDGVVDPNAEEEDNRKGDEDFLKVHILIAIWVVVLASVSLLLLAELLHLLLLSLLEPLMKPDCFFFLGFLAFSCS